MSNPLISIVLCTYNGERFLKYQIDSLLAQTYQPLEIIISDDCSSDDTITILNNYMAEPLVNVYFQTENLGYSKNFEFACSKASGKYLAFCDQDDVWLPEKLRKLHAGIGNSLLVFSDSELVDENGKHIGKNLSDMRRLANANDTRGFIFSNIVWGHTMLIESGLLKYVLPIPAGIPHDIWIAFKATSLTGIRFVNEALTLYRQHSKTLTKTIGEKTTARPSSQRYKDYEEKIKWIKLMHANEQGANKAFYLQLSNLFRQKAKGRFVWPLFFFLMKNRGVLFHFTRKNTLSQVLEIRKLSRGESI